MEPQMTEVEYILYLCIWTVNDEEKKSKLCIDKTDIICDM